MANESNDGSFAIEAWRSLHGLVDTRRPWCSRFKQHPHNRRERRIRRTRWVNEAPSIKMIALISAQSE
jgi:hypothetical protein